MKDAQLPPAPLNHSAKRLLLLRSLRSFYVPPIFNTTKMYFNEVVSVFALVSAAFAAPLAPRAEGKASALCYSNREMQSLMSSVAYFYQGGNPGACSAPLLLQDLGLTVNSQDHVATSTPITLTLLLFHIPPTQAASQSRSTCLSHVMMLTIGIAVVGLSRFLVMATPSLQLLPILAHRASMGTLISQSGLSRVSCSWLGGSFPLVNKKYLSSPWQSGGRCYQRQLVD